MKNAENIGAVSNEIPPWTVNFSGKAEKQVLKMPGYIQDSVQAFRKIMEWEGPEPKLPHYGKLRS
jgi:mRNA-degrading endonuclease RelE of RelBE toxin-antitoxin system